jgi:DNA-binding IclR family transcriptional regulator
VNKAASAESDEDSANPGAHQNIARAALTLDALASAGSSGLRLTDIVRITGLNKTVAHRCLAGLVAHGLASYEQDGALFFLGDRIFAWVSKAHERYELAERVAPHLRRLADELEDTIYFFLRRGDEVVCYGRAEGSFPIKTLTVNVGDRRPLGVGGGSLSIAAFLPDEEVDRLVREQATARKKFRISDDMLRKDVAKTRKTGFAIMEGHIVEGMTGIGVPIRNESGVPVASLSIAAISPRLEGPRRQQVVARLKAEAAAVETRLRSLLADV